MGEKGWLQKILKVLPEAKKGITHSVLVSFFYEGIKFIPIIIIKYIVDFFVQGQDNVVKLAYAILSVLVSYVALVAIDFISQKKAFHEIRSYETELLRKAKKKMLELHLGYHETFSTGTQVSKINKGVHRLAELFWFVFEEFIPTIIQLAITLALLLYEQWVLAALFALFTPLILWITLNEGKKVQPLRKKYHQRYDEAIGELGESLLNISTVKDYVQEKQQFKRFDALLDKYRQLAVERFDFSHKFLLWRDLVIILGRVVTLAVTSYLVFHGALSAGSLVLVYTLTERAFLATYRIGRLYSYLGDALESIERLIALLKEKPAIRNISGAKEVHQLKGGIQFRKVSFSYRSGEEVLGNIDLSISPKQIVALVGRSGSGKTTITKLLLRNYDVEEGEILVDGKNIKNYRIEDYKKRLAVVSQNVEIFNRTIFENISFAKTSASRQEVMAAAQKAHAHEFIMDFQHGYDTLVGEKGIRLSGGQKQRISIARALLKDPDIYIFDEATSSLDTESEQYIQNSIFSIAGKKTTIIIAHRLSTIRKADVIVVLDKGKIVEQGSYEELLQRRGQFWKMVQLQEMAELRE